MVAAKIRKFSNCYKNDKESQKIGRKMPNVELTWQQIDVLITDNKLSQADKEAIMAQGVEVICVDVA